jgi:hypothetical protein
MYGVRGIEVVKHVLGLEFYMAYADVACSRGNDNDFMLS